MLKKRVIFSLLYDTGHFVLSRNFRLQRVGDIHWLKKNYDFSKIAFSIDELIILDVTRRQRDPDLFREHVTALTEECFVPIAAGGGIRNIEDVRELLKSGADKVVLNTLLSSDWAQVREIAAEFGSQCIVASIDIKQMGDTFGVWVANGERQLEIEAKKYLRQVIELPVGEIYLNSIDRDGTGQGYLVELTHLLPPTVKLPVIIAGGAGHAKHFSEVLGHERVDAVATAHLFNFVADGLQRARSALIDQGFVLPTWDMSSADELRGSLQH